MRKIQSTTNSALTEANLEDGMIALKTAEAFLYIPIELSHVAEIILDYNFRKKMFKKANFRIINIIPVIDKSLKDTEWYLFCKNGEYHSKGDGSNNL